MFQLKNIKIVIEVHGVNMEVVLNTGNRDLMGFYELYNDGSTLILNSRDGDVLKDMLFSTESVRCKYYKGYKFTEVRDYNIKSVKYFITRRGIKRYVLEVQ